MCVCVWGGLAWVYILALGNNMKQTPFDDVHIHFWFLVLFSCFLAVKELITVRCKIFLFIMCTFRPQNKLD